MVNSVYDEKLSIARRQDLLCKKIKRDLSKWGRDPSTGSSRKVHKLKKLVAILMPGSKSILGLLNDAQKEFASAPDGASILSLLENVKKELVVAEIMNS